jgi:hypothetical protein
MKQLRKSSWAASRLLALFCGWGCVKSQPTEHWVQLLLLLHSSQGICFYFCSWPLPNEEVFLFHSKLLRLFFKSWNNVGFYQVVFLLKWSSFSFKFVHMIKLIDFWILNRHCLAWISLTLSWYRWARFAKILVRLFTSFSWVMFSLLLFLMMSLFNHRAMIAPLTRTVPHWKFVALVLLLPQILVHFTIETVWACSLLCHEDFIHKFSLLADTDTV